MNQRERAQRMVALLTQSFEMGWDGRGAEDQINVFEGDVIAKVTPPDVEGLTPEQARTKGIGAGFTEGLRFAATVIDLVAVAGLRVEQLHPEVDFREIIRSLGIYAAALPDDKE